MAGWQIDLLVLAACLLGARAYSDAGKYLVTAPEKAWPGSVYTVTVQVFATASPVHVSAFLEVDAGYSSAIHDRLYRPATPVSALSLLPGSTEMLKIQVPDNIDTLHTCRLRVRGTGGLQIEETYSIAVNPRTASVFIQTDKPLYAPGETVTFKTFGFYLKDLTSYTGVYDVTLARGDNMVLSKWRSLSGQAMNTFTFDLDTHTYLGAWYITVSSRETGSTRQGFTVGHEKKELTTEPASGTAGVYSGSVIVESSAIDVKVHLPKTMNSSTDLTGSFEATYPLGVGVKGTAEITVFSNRVTTNTIPFTGSGTFTFPYMSLSAEDTRVTVRVTDEGTGVVGEGEGRVKVFMRDVKIQITEQTPAIYKPKLPFTVYIKITNNADEPLHVPAGSVYSAVYVYGVGHYYRQVPSAGHGSSSYSGTYPLLGTRLTLPDSGLLSVDLNIPEEVTSVDLVVTFQGVQKKVTLQQAQHSESDSYLQISLIGGVPAVTRTHNADVNFRVLSSQPLNDLVVETVSRGRIVSAVQPTLTNRGTSGDAYSAEFSVTLTWDMTPVTEVIAYHTVMKSNAVREVVSDSMALNVDRLLDDPITVTSDAQRVTPGQEVTLTVQARAGAYVGVLVEESNRGSNEVVTLESVAGAIQQNDPKPLKEAMATSSRSGTGSFATAHLLLMNGGVLYRDQQTSPMKQTAYSDQQSPEKPHTVYLGTNTTGADGLTTFTVALPDSVTVWSVTGFVFDHTGHVAVVHQPLQIEAVYDIYGELLGPDHVVSGEQVVLTAYVHNARNIQSQVTATLRPTANVQALHISPNVTFQATSLHQQQTVTIPPKGSRRLFFVVISPVGTPLYTSTAQVELLLSSGESNHTVPFSYTVTPRGVEQTFTFSDLTRVDGHVTKALSVPHAHPTEAMPDTATTRVTLTERFSDLLLPLVLAEADVMEEGTELAALLHFALPVMLAKYRPDMATQLKTPIARGYQRLVMHWDGYSGSYPTYPGSDLFSDWVDMTAMQMTAEAREHVYVSDTSVTGVLYTYYSQWGGNNLTALWTSRLRTANKLMTTEALEALYCIVVQDLQKHVNVRQHGDYDMIMYRVHNFLNNTCLTPPPAADPLTLSYLALACVRYGFSADRPMTQLVAVASHASDTGDVMFWDTHPNDSFKYFGDWLPGRHVAGSADLVTAANALRVLVHSGLTSQAEGVARWLLRQRHGNGFFTTAWDTLAATEALLVYEHQPGANASHVHLNRHATNRNGSQWTVGSPPDHFTASGHGEVYSQVEVKFYVEKNVGDSPYDVVPVVLDESLHHFKLMVCNRWLLLNETSGVTVQHVTLPSGFVASTSGLASQAGVMTVVQHSKAAFTLYFNEVGRDSTCYTVTADRVGDVAHSSPSSVYTSSFTTPEYRDITMYHTRRLADSNVCDLCPSCCP